MNAQKNSLVTCCPACAANFYVTPDQLSMYRGEVRCGKCNHIFNAFDRLSELPDTLLSADTNNEIVIEPLINEEVALQIAQPEATVDKIHTVATINAGAYSTIAPLEAGPKITWDLASKNKLNRAGKRKPHIRLLIFLALMLTILAATQTTYYMRTQIASRWPILKPNLIKACELLHCTVELPKHIELLTIDDSDLQEDAEHKGLIHLSSTIINNAVYIQAYPLLEVTLTDNYDKPILRRAFNPAEYLPKGTNISQGMAAGEEIRIELSLSASGEPVAGYRVFVTYS